MFHSTIQLDSKYRNILLFVFVEDKIHEPLFDPIKICIESLTSSFFFSLKSTKPWKANILTPHLFLPFYYQSNMVDIKLFKTTLFLKYTKLNLNLFHLTNIYHNKQTLR